MKSTCKTVFYLVFIFCSCTSSAKLAYLQDQKADNEKTEELIKTIRFQESQYRLRPTDRLQLNVFSLTDEKINFLKNPEVEVKVDDRGQIELPVMGWVDINGLTIKEAEEKLKKVASDYLKSPIITVKLLNFNFTVIGEVNQQGTFNSVDPKINILEAIGRAGGLTENANKTSIRIVRNENNTAKIYQLNILEDNSLSSNYFFLQPNDIILVNPLQSITKKQDRIAMVSFLVSIATSLTFLTYYIINETN